MVRMNSRLYIKIKNFSRMIKQFLVRKIFIKTFRDNFISNDFGFKRGEPVDRFYIDSFIKKHSHLIRGVCLEFGGSDYTHKYGSIDAEQNIFNYSEEPYRKGKIIMGDITKLNTLEEGVYDCIICTNVLNFIFDVNYAILGLKKLIKPCGKIILTTAGVTSHISRYDMNRWGDFWRMTDKSIIKLAEKAGLNIDMIETYGNPYACTSQLNGLSVQDLEIEKLNNTHQDYQLLVACILSK